jgi:hypothetical protein
MILLLFACVFLYGWCVVGGALIAKDIDNVVKKEITIGMTKTEVQTATDRIREEKGKWVDSRYVSVDYSTNEWLLTVREGDIYRDWMLYFQEDILAKMSYQKRQLPSSKKIQEK